MNTNEVARMTFAQTLYKAADAYTAKTGQPVEGSLVATLSGKKSMSECLKGFDPNTDYGKVHPSFLGWISSQWTGAGLYAPDDNQSTSTLREHIIKWLEQHTSVHGRRLQAWTYKGKTGYSTRNSTMRQYLSYLTDQGVFSPGQLVQSDPELSGLPRWTEPDKARFAAYVTWARQDLTVPAPIMTLTPTVVTAVTATPQPTADPTVDMVTVAVTILSDSQLVRVERNSRLHLESQIVEACKRARWLKPKTVYALVQANLDAGVPVTHLDGLITAAIAIARKG